MLAKKLC